MYPYNTFNVNYVNTSIFPIPDLKLQQSDTWSIILCPAGYSPQSYTISYVIVKASGGTPQTFVSAPLPSDPSQHQILIPSTTTTSFVPGEYSIQVYAIEIATGNKTTLGNTQVRVLPDLSLAANVNTKTLNEQTLDAINIALSQNLTSTTVEYTVAGRAFKENRTELIKIRNYYVNLVRKEKGLLQGTNIYYGF